MVTRFLAVLFVTTIERVVRCVRDTRIAEWLSRDRTIKDYTHDETSDMFLTLGALIVEMVALHGFIRYVILVDANQMLICFDDCRSAFAGYEVLNTYGTSDCKSPMDCTDTSRLR